MISKACGRVTCRVPARRGAYAPARTPSTGRRAPRRCPGRTPAPRSCESRATGFASPMAGRRTDPRRGSGASPSRRPCGRADVHRSTPGHATPGDSGFDAIGPSAPTRGSASVHGGEFTAALCPGRSRRPKPMPSRAPVRRTLCRPLCPSAAPRRRRRRRASGGVPPEAAAGHRHQPRAQLRRRGGRPHLARRRPAVPVRARWGHRVAPPGDAAGGRAARPAITASRIAAAMSQALGPGDRAGEQHRARRAPWRGRRRSPCRSGVEDHRHVHASTMS